MPSSRGSWEPRDGTHVSYGSYIAGRFCTTEPLGEAHSAGDRGLIPGLGSSPGEGNGYSLQYSCLRKPTDRGVWQATVHGVAKELGTTGQLNNNSNSKVLGAAVVLLGPV